MAFTSSQNSSWLKRKLIACANRLRSGGRLTLPVLVSPGFSDELAHYGDLSEKAGQKRARRSFSTRWTALQHHLRALVTGPGNSSHPNVRRICSHKPCSLQALHRL